MAILHGPTHHTIVVVDVEGFGHRRRTNPHQRGVRDGLHHVMQTAFDNVGVPWADCYHEDRGDSVFILAPASTSKAVFVETLPPTLITALRIHNDTHPDAQRIRLRMALHAGEVHYDDHGVASASLNLAFRLLDAKPLKSALAASPGVLAVITSDWYFEDVVRHTPGAAPTTYRPVHVTEKETTTIGWITLPDHPYPPDTTQLTAPVAVPHAMRQSRLVPRQLPLAVRDFTGRTDHLAALDALIPPDPGLDRPDSTGTPAVIITAIDGTAGIGKTTLAVHWAHRAQHLFPDGTLHANLRGYGPGEPTTPGEILDGFLRALGAPAEKMPLGVDAQAALYRTLVDGRRMLIVLDNANSANQIRPLLPGTAGCMVLVTSRDSLTGLVVTEAAHRLTLDLLTPPEALHLVTGIIGPDRAAAEPDAVTDLIRLCARLPLALRIAASKVAAHPHTTVGEVVAELVDESNLLTTLSSGGDEQAAVRAVFDWSYQRLPAEQARLFRRLGLHPGLDLSVPAAAAVAGLDLPVTRRLLGELAGAHLIEPTARGRYRLHDLLRAYAVDQAHHHDQDEDRRSALQAVLGWYAHTAHTCDELVFPAYWRLSRRLPAPTRQAPILNRPQALDWQDDERRNLHAALQYAIRNGLYQHAVQLADSMRFLAMSGSWDDAFDVYSSGLQAARGCGDGTAEVAFYNRRGSICVLSRRWDQAQADLGQALVLANATNDQAHQAWALNELGLLYSEREQFEDALPFLRQALPLSRGIDTGRWEAVVEGNLSRACASLGRYQQALEHGERGLALRRHVGDIIGEPYALHHIAQVWQGLGDHNKTISMCRQAITLGRTVGDVAGTVAAPLDTLAMSLHHLGDTDEAVACWREAAVLFDDCGRPHHSARVRQRLHSAQTGERDDSD